MKDISNYSLLSHNTFGIDVKCKRFIEYNSIEELRSCLPTITQEPVLHIGGGSNLLFTKDFEGTILHSAILGKEVISCQDDSVTLKVGAGEDWDGLVDWCVNKGYYGLENLSYIPGEVGASAIQNIGAYGTEVEQYIEAVEAIEIATGEERLFSHDECQYGYRKSIFKAELKNRFIITHVYYKLSRSFVPNLSYGALQKNHPNKDITARELRASIINIRRNKLPEPKEIGSAGSFFMNPIVSREVFNQIVVLYPNMPYYEVDDKVKIPAGWMIEQCGWKGKQLGNAGVYAKQALVLVNHGGASGQEIVTLSKKIQEDVKEKFGIEIHPEVIFI